ncbi:polysaccharide ABC transporter ATP-binding protein [Paractinoplanes abujensis]|uniref:Putative aldouronate transport system permease protein n=1 Tax=Paractinoplanes abujensis TaxID=882441 RepID=A0A7W7CPB9_9ACTN|nr:ABC transporter permease subunit [Actinoplanes abujensis]MBB4692263.1 putative aldouronate transport system permease protein [Actinoplanes abujensis]GID24257.1 polysaccharide ABC transporter ATP-binding protein [Actinoplanes abujensis]
MTALHDAPPALRAPEDQPVKKSRFRRDRSLLLMVVPAIVLLIVFNYVPMFGTATAFQRYSIYAGFWHSPWTGLETFRQLFSDPLFWSALGNTLILSLVQLIFYFPVPIALALLLHSIMSNKVRTIVQSVVYLPHFFSWVLAVTIFQQMLGGAGALNQFLRQNGIGTWDVMTDPDTFALLVTSQVIWKEAGWGIIVFLAALAAIDTQLYEAAAADGAGRWRRLWHITLPGIRGVIVLMLVLRLGNVLTVGFEQMLIQRGAVGRDAAEVLDTYAYYYGVVNANFSLGAAASLFKGVLSLLFLLAANKIAHLLGEDGLYRR